MESALNSRLLTYVDGDAIKILTTSDLICGRNINKKCFNDKIRIGSKKEDVQSSLQHMIDLKMFMLCHQRNILFKLNDIIITTS